MHFTLNKIKKLKLTDGQFESFEFGEIKVFATEATEGTERKNCMLIEIATVAFGSFAMTIC